MKTMISILKPEAFPGETVIFENPRLRREDKREAGLVVHVETHWLSQDPKKYENPRYQPTEHLYYVKPVGKNYTVIVRRVELVPFSPVGSLAYHLSSVIDGTSDQLGKVGQEVKLNIDQ